MDGANELDEPWHAALELAWEAYLAGTIPVGSVVADADGRIVARGRNRIFEPPGHGLSAKADFRRRPMTEEENDMS